MSKLSRTVAAVATIASTLALCGTAAGATRAVIEYSDTFTTQVPGTSSGRVENVLFKNADDPEAKPPAISRVFTRLPAGGGLHTRAGEECRASDAQPLAEGP